MYIDTHCHFFLDGDSFNFEPEEVVKNSIKSGVETIWLSSTNIADINKNISLTEKFPNNLKTFVGFHPEEYRGYDSTKLEDVLKKYCFAAPLNSTVSQQLSANNQPVISDHCLLPTNSPIIGIGEIGVDLHWNKPSTLKYQQSVFEDQIKLAIKYNLPVALHSRDAYEETLDVLRNYKNLKFIWHSYNLELEKTEFLLNQFPNIFFGFNNIITYNSGLYIQNSVKALSNDKIVFETDAPFLAPRTEEFNDLGYNTPGGVINVYNKVAKLKGISVEELQGIVHKNCDSLVSKVS